MRCRGCTAWVSSAILSWWPAPWSGATASPWSGGLALWLAYNRHLVHHHERMGFPLLSFDDDGRVFLDKVKQVVAGLDLGLDPEKISFFDPDFRHELEEECLSLPVECAELHKDLLSRAL